MTELPRRTHPNPTCVLALSGAAFASRQTPDRLLATPARPLPASLHATPWWPVTLARDPISRDHLRGSSPKNSHEIQPLTGVGTAADLCLPRHAPHFL